MYKYHLINKLIEDIQREDSKIRVQDIANEMNISKGMLDQVKSGRSNPTVDTAEKIARYFKKDMNYFFDLEATEASVQIVTPEFLLKRYEELVIENGKLNDRVKDLEGSKKYSKSSVPSLMVADPQT